MFGLARTQITTPASSSVKGALVGSSAVFSANLSAQVLDVSPEGVLDWFIPFQSGPASGGVLGASKSPAVSSLAGSLQDYYRLIGGTGTGQGTQGSISTTVNSDAADSAGGALAATNSSYAISALTPFLTGAGFGLQVPFSQKVTRNVNLYIFFWPGSAGHAGAVTVKGDLTDGSVPQVLLTLNDAGTNGAITVFKVNFHGKGGLANCNLRVTATMSTLAGVSNAIGLLAATLF